MTGVSDTDENNDPDSDPSAAARREADPIETARANRTWWDIEADDYYAEHGSFLGDDDFVWGPEGLREAAGSVPVQVSTATGLLTVFFSQEPVLDYAGARACDLERYAAWCRQLLARGVYPPPSQFEAWFPSLAHTAEHVERTIEAAHAAFAEVA